MSASSLRLWEAGDAIEIVRDWLDEHDDEIRANEGAIPDELAELLAKVEGDFNRKAERVALFIRELQATAKAIKEEEERLRDRRKSRECAVDRLKRYLELQMLEHTIPRIEGKLVTLRIQKNPPSVTNTLTQEQLAELHRRVPEAVTFHPATYAINARYIIDLAKFPDPDDPKKSVYVSPLEGVEVTQGASLRIA